MKVTRRNCLTYLGSAAMLLAVPVLSYAQFAPNVKYFSLLDQVRVDVKSGKFMLGRLDMGFLPKGNAKLAGTLKKAGQPITTYSFMSVMGKHPFKNMMPMGGDVGLDEGSYELEFTLGGKPFYKFPFTVWAKDKNDPYAENPRMFFVDGPWNEFGALQVKHPDQRVFWKAYHRNEDMSVRQKNGVRLIELYRNGKLFATSQEASSQKVGTPVTGYHQWYGTNVKLYKIQDGGETPILYGKDLLQSTGKYEVREKILDHYLYKNPAMNDGPHKTPRLVSTNQYYFAVKDGRIVVQGRQNRDQADPLYFIEGGRSLTWLQKAKGAYLTAS